MAWSGRFSPIGRLGRSLCPFVDPRSGPDVRNHQLEARGGRFLSLQCDRMEATTLRWRNLGVITVCLVLAAQAFGTPEIQPATDRQITIRIHDYAQSNPSVRQKAEEAAGNILQKAGVASRWIDCTAGSSGTGDCAGAGSPLDFVVNLLPYSMSERLHQRRGVLGYTPDASGNHFGFITWVFYDVAKERSVDYQQDFGELLGDAIAHELGHLLLGNNSHSDWGLMSAFWSGEQLRLASQGWLAFSNQESARIQLALSARVQAETARDEVAKSSSVAPSGGTFMARVPRAAEGSEGRPLMPLSEATKPRN